MVTKYTQVPYQHEINANQTHTKLYKGLATWEAFHGLLQPTNHF